jgi:hypothetical protein
MSPAETNMGGGMKFMFRRRDQNGEFTIGEERGFKQYTFRFVSVC